MRSSSRRWTMMRTSPPGRRRRADAGATVRTWEVRSGEFSPAPRRTWKPLLNERTRLVAFTHASNISWLDPGRGRRDPAGAGESAGGDGVHRRGALHAAQSRWMCGALDCDFLACSAYKFCGPHLGILYGKYAHLDRLEAYKVRASTNVPPGKWETGTQSFESIAGLRRVSRLSRAGLAATGHADRFIRAMHAVKDYEAGLSRRFLEGVQRHPGFAVIWGGGAVGVRIVVRRRSASRSKAGSRARLPSGWANEGIFVGDGHFYAMPSWIGLGLADRGGSGPPRVCALQHCG